MAREPKTTICPHCGKRAVGRDIGLAIYCEHCGGTMATRGKAREAMHGDRAVFPERSESDTMTTPDAAAKAREIVGRLVADMDSKGLLPVGPSKLLDIAARIAAALTEARRDRDMEWWQALCLVDTVAPTPEAVKAFLLSLSAEARATAIEEAVKVVEEWFERDLFYVAERYGGAEPDLAKIAAAIRRLGEP